MQKWKVTAHYPSSDWHRYTAILAGQSRLSASQQPVWTILKPPAELLGLRSSISPTSTILVRRDSRTGDRTAC